jgi:hypothetical protein
MCCIVELWLRFPTTILLQVFKNTFAQYIPVIRKGFCLQITDSTIAHLEYRLYHDRFSISWSARLDAPSIRKTASPLVRNRCATGYSISNFLGTCQMYQGVCSPSPIMETCFLRSIDNAPAYKFFMFCAIRLG